jgi:hypothetical protein
VIAINVGMKINIRLKIYLIIVQLINKGKYKANPTQKLCKGEKLIDSG